MSTILAKHFDLSSLYDKPVSQKPKPKSAAPISAQDIAASWFGNFGRAIEEKDAAAVAALFQEDGMQTCESI